MKIWCRNKDNCGEFYGLLFILCGQQKQIATIEGSTAQYVFYTGSKKKKFTHCDFLTSPFFSFLSHPFHCLFQNPSYLEPPTKPSHHHTSTVGSAIISPLPSTLLKQPNFLVLLFEPVSLHLQISFLQNQVDLFFKRVRTFFFTLFYFLK